MVPEIIIEAGRTEKQYWRDLWRYRELFYFLAWRDILVRYKQTVIGVAWSLIRPLVTLIIFTVIFGRIARLPTHGIPYPLFVMAGMLPWQFFSTALSEASTSLVSNANLISKIYFPRLIVPAGSVITSLVDFLISAVFLGALMLWYARVPDWRIVFVPFFILLAFAASMGTGLWLAALNVKYRDFRYIVPFIVQFGLYVSPVPYSSQSILDKLGMGWYLIYWLNPMVGVIEGFRWCILGVASIYLPGLFLSIGLTAVSCLTGIWYFRRTEKTFADFI